MHRWTLKDIEKLTIREIIELMIQERKTLVSNQQAPTSIMLRQLRQKIKKIHCEELDKKLKGLPEDYKVPRGRIWTKEVRKKYGRQKDG